MAPRKRKAKEGQEKANPAVPLSTRVTRSSARLANAKVTESAPPELPTNKKKKGKAAEVTAKKKTKEESSKAEVKDETDTKKEEEEAKEENEAALEENIGGDAPNKTIVVEHCKQCNSFKTRATLVKNGLEEEIPGITVLLNPDKPRKGCFEIREEGGEIFISLLDMKRPFKPMKDLDMKKVISDIVDKIK